MSPSRRLTARELVLPWAHLSVPARWRQVNQSAFAVGTLVVTGAYLKAANAGSCRLVPKLVIAVRLVEKPRAWRSWYAGQTYRTTVGGKERRREQARRRRERVRQRSALAQPASPMPLVEPALPVIEVQATPDSIPIIPASTQSVGQRPAEISPKSCCLPCSRPGCYVLFLARRVLPINISVPAHAAGHYGEFANAKPGSGVDVS